MNIAVVVHPNAKKPRIETDLFGTLHVYVSAPPLEGKANRAAGDALAAHLGVRRSRVLLVSGEKSKHKTFLVAGELPQ